jgi:hypothetical protein
MEEWDRQHSISHWHDDRAKYQATLESESLKAWEIASAVGFAGVVIAKTIEDITHEYHQSPNQAMWRTAPPLRERDFVNVHQALNIRSNRINQEQILISHVSESSWFEIGFASVRSA